MAHSVTRISLIPQCSSMNARFSEIRNSKLFANDELVGDVVDLLVEDEHWMVRYLVVEICNSESESSKRVLISTAAIADCDLEACVFKTVLDSQHVKDSPILDDKQSVSRQHEQALVEHYGWPMYWIGSAVLPPQQLDALAGDEPSLFVDETTHVNLRSASEICGYSIRSRNGSAGVMNDLVVNTQRWSVSHGVAEASSWLPSESSMFSTNHIESVDWSNREVNVDLSREVLLPEPTAIESFSQSLQTRQLGIAQRSSMG